MLAPNLWHVELLQIHSLLKIMSTYQSIIKLFHQISDCSIATKQNKVVQWFVKPLIVILFRTHPVTVRFNYDFRFGTTILNYHFSPHYTAIL